MTPEALRADIPACEAGAYLNTGASGPAPESVIDATCEFVRYHEAVAPTNEGAYPAAFDTLDELHGVVADFLGCDASDVALTESTAHGIASVAAALDWERGDVVVRTDLEHPAGILPWWNLEREGVETRVLECPAGRIDREALADAVADAKLLCLNSITWNYGTRLPIREVVEVAHDAGTMVLVDAVQSFGQRPVDVTEWGADFVVGAGHKWLLGPWGAGFCYVHPDRLDDLHPALVGYRSVEAPNAAVPTLKPSAGRLEVGTTSPAPYVGLRQAIENIEAVGYDTVVSRTERLTDRLKEGLGDRLVGPREFESGLVPFRADDPTATVERLADAGVYVRDLPDPEVVRASVHVFNTAEDVDALLDAL
jgi:selenocysteine lyase/cysteine desulfurase